MTTGIDPSRAIHFWLHRLYADWKDDACRNRVVQVIVYPTTEQLQRAAAQYARKDVHRRSEDFSESAGVFHPCPFRSKYNRRTRTWIDTTSAFAGVMRLSQEALTSEVIAHESTHAALHITRLHDWGKPETDGVANFGPGCDWHEEAFAYLLGEIVQQVSDKAWEIRELVTT